MNLDEFRNAMASDAAKENEQLKHEVSVLRDQLRDSRNYCEELRQLMNNDCRLLANRCWVLTRGSMCCFCNLSMFDCPHAWSNDQIVEAAKKMREETNNA